MQSGQKVDVALTPRQLTILASAALHRVCFLEFRRLQNTWVVKTAGLPPRPGAELGKTQETALSTLHSGAPVPPQACWDVPGSPLLEASPGSAQRLIHFSQSRDVGTCQAGAGEQSSG